MKNEEWCVVGAGVAFYSQAFFFTAEAPRPRGGVTHGLTAKFGNTYL